MMVWLSLRVLLRTMLLVLLLVWLWLLLVLVGLLNMSERHFLHLVLLLILMNLLEFSLELDSLFHDDTHLNYVCQVRFSSVLFDFEWHFFGLNLSLLGHSAEFDELCDEYQVRYCSTKRLKSDLRLIVLEVMLHQLEVEF